jgi:hypothetical protein
VSLLHFDLVVLSVAPADQEIESLDICLSMATSPPQATICYARFVYVVGHLVSLPHFDLVMSLPPTPTFSGSQSFQADRESVVLSDISGACGSSRKSLIEEPF